MDIIKRYVYAVGRQLPDKKKADIQKELESTLMDELEARYGKDASEEQAIVLLKEFGRPEKVAASYWPEGQYLIGPRLFPLFRLVAGIAITIFVIVQLILYGVAVIFIQESLPGVEFLGNILGSALGAFGTIVLVFAVLQRLDVRPDLEKEEWDPRELPEIEEKDDISRVGILVEIILALIFTAVLVALSGSVGVIVSPGSELILNPVIGQFVPLIVISLLASIGLDVFLLWRGRWETSTRIAKILINLLGIVVLALLIVAHNIWLAEHGVTGIFSFADMIPSEGQLSAEQVQILVVNGFRIGFLVALIVSIVETIGDIIRLVRRLAGGKLSLTI
jgi:hypothetical protein